VPSAAKAGLVAAPGGTAEAVPFPFAACLYSNSRTAESRTGPIANEQNFTGIENKACVLLGMGTASAVPTQR